MHLFQRPHNLFRIRYRAETTQTSYFVSNDLFIQGKKCVIQHQKSKELKRGFQFKIDLFANSSVYDLHRQMNISLELNKLYLKKLI